MKEDLSEDLRQTMTFHFVTNIDEVLTLALTAKAAAPQPGRRRSERSSHAGTARRAASRT